MADPFTQSSPRGLVGLWMYRNDGGMAILDRLRGQLTEAGYRVVWDFDMRQCYVLEGRVYTVDGFDLSSLDILYHMNIDEHNPYQIEILRALELSGVNVFNDWNAFTTARDKFHTNAILRRNGLHVPPAALLHKSTKRSFIDRLFELWGRVVYKPRQNHGAIGVMLFDTAEMLWDFILTTRPYVDSYYFEKYIPFGEHDYRVEIFNNEVIGGYSRRRNHRFKTNVTQGGAMLPIPPTTERQQIALRAAKILNVTTTIVDMIESIDNGQTYILEVNPIMGIFVESAMRAGTKMPVTEPDPAYSNDEKKLACLVQYINSYFGRGK
ncbi:MAG: hypothetical protein MJE77_04630 [Proteobacteria bacterium]|nr:hypothetical protein [Pseudomonadota bacterium]